LGRRQVKKAAKVSRQLGLDTHVTFPGSLAWPYFYPYPQRPDGLIEACFEEQARRWKPILDEFDQHGVDVCFEIHPERGHVRRRYLRALPRQGRRA
jgi:Xylose isomerase-like TIM barrel.